jgi:hypothetical protein
MRSLIRYIFALHHDCASFQVIKSQGQREKLMFPEDFTYIIINLDTINLTKLFDIFTLSSLS